MNEIVNRALLGLTKDYLFRQYFFGVIIGGIFYSIFTSSGDSVLLVTFFVVINTLLYPYSRFVYERVMSFLIGNNFFMVNGIFFLMFKCITMAWCWMASLMIAPVGLAYLYFKNAPK